MNASVEEVISEEEQSVDVGETQTSGEEETNYEEEARWQGWVPQEQFRGPKDAWLPAEDFVRKGREINAILRANNDRLIRDFGNLEKQNRLYAEQIRELRESQRGINQRDFDTTLAFKNKQRMAALKAGDEDLFLQLDQDIANLLLSRGELIDGKSSQSQKGDSSDSSSDNADPVFDAWVTENDWYGRDEFRTVAVNRIAEKMREHYPNLQGRAFLDAVLRSAIKRYPEDFGVSYTSNRRSIGDIGDPGTVIRQSTGKTERDLPADAKAAMDAFVAEKLGTKDQYLKLYFEE